MKGAEAPLTYFTDGGGGGGGVLGIFLGQKFWPKGKFACMNDAGIFLGCEKNIIISAILLVWDILGYIV